MNNNKRTKLELIRDLKSGNYELRDSAIEALRADGSLYDFSLKGINLRGVDLSGADLTEARMDEAILDEAILQETTLTRAWFHRASLIGADLTNASMRACRLGLANLENAILIAVDAGKTDFYDANMTGANCYLAGLWGTNLSRTNLTNADLRMANLRGATLNYTVLDNTRLKEASIGGTTFASIDFTQPLGLTQVEFAGPCHIDIDSLYRSRGEIPKEFLRGCGIPDTMITYIKSIVNSSKPFEFYDIFLSFSGEDNKFAEQLFQALEIAGISCWKYDRQQHLGEDLYDNIDAGFKASDKVVFISSKSAWNSDYVLDELKYALSQERKNKVLTLIPITIDDTLDNPQNVLMNIISQKIYATFKGWEEDKSIFRKGVQHLVTALSKKLASED